MYNKFNGIIHSAGNFKHKNDKTHARIMFAVSRFSPTSCRCGPTKFLHPACTICQNLVVLRNILLPWWLDATNSWYIPGFLPRPCCSQLRQWGELSDPLMQLQCWLPLMQRHYQLPWASAALQQQQRPAECPSGSGTRSRSAWSRQWRVGDSASWQSAQWGWSGGQHSEITRVRCKCVLNLGDASELAQGVPLQGSLWI